MPIKFCKQWPPKPLNKDGSINEGAYRNAMVFKPDLVYRDWYNKAWDAAVCATEVAQALRKHGC